MQTGPRTAEGKARSCRNSLQHGLTSRQVLVPGENQADFDALRASIFDEYDPGTPTEVEMTEELAVCAWRLRRARRVESENFDKLGTPEFDRILRYITTIERAWTRTLRDLTARQKDRRAQQHSDAAANAKQAAADFDRNLEEFIFGAPRRFRQEQAASATAASAAAGFVSQNGPAAPQSDEIVFTNATPGAPAPAFASSLLQR